MNLNMEGMIELEIILGRIDNRLLHGIVAAQWSPLSKCTRLMVIDDKVASDPILKESMRVAKPIGMSLSIITLETALKNFKAGKYEGQRIFAVAKKPRTFIELVNSGINIKKINIGGSAFLDDETIKLSNRAAASEKDIIDYKKLIESGTEVTIQYVPNDSEQKFNY